MPVSTKQVSTYCMNNCTESLSFFPENCGGSFNFTEKGNPQACCTCAHSMPTSLISAAIYAICGLCADMAHSTAFCGKVLHATAILKRYQTSTKGKHNKQNKPNKFTQKNCTLFEIIKKKNLAGILFLQTAVTQKQQDTGQTLFIACTTLQDALR